MLGMFHDCIPPYFWTWNPELMNLSKLVANEFQDLLVFKQTKKCWGYRRVSLHMAFYMDVGDPNLGLNAYMAGT